MEVKQKMAHLNNNRESWASRMGFILAAAGSAIGLGNIWRFPYMTGEHGGAAFLIIYLVAIVLIGYPVMVNEIIIGRKTNRNPVGWAPSKHSPRRRPGGLSAA